MGIVLQFNRDILPGLDPYGVLRPAVLVREESLEYVVEELWRTPWYRLVGEVRWASVFGAIAGARKLAMVLEPFRRPHQLYWTLARREGLGAFWPDMAAREAGHGRTALITQSSDDFGSQCCVGIWRDDSVGPRGIVAGLPGGYDTSPAVPIIFSIFFAYQEGF